MYEYGGYGFVTSLSEMISKNRNGKAVVSVPKGARIMPPVVVPDSEKPLYLGAISNEAGLEGKHIGTIEMNGRFSFVDLPKGMPSDIFNLLKKTWVRSRRMAISKCA